MASAESSDHITARTEHSNEIKNQENDLKNIMKMVEALKEKIKNLMEDI